MIYSERDSNICLEHNVFDKIEAEEKGYCDKCVYSIECLGRMTVEQYIHKMRESNESNSR